MPGGLPGADRRDRSPAARAAGGGLWLGGGRGGDHGGRDHRAAGRDDPRRAGRPIPGAGPTNFATAHDSRVGSTPRLGLPPNHTMNTLSSVLSSRTGLAIPFGNTPPVPSPSKTPCCSDHCSAPPQPPHSRRLLPRSPPHLRG